MNAGHTVFELFQDISCPMSFMSSVKPDFHLFTILPHKGRVHFTLDYSFNNNTLTVGVMEAQDVPAKDFSGTSDPYARVMLLPDRKKKFDTRVSMIFGMKLSYLNF